MDTRNLRIGNLISNGIITKISKNKVQVNEEKTFHRSDIEPIHLVGNNVSLFELHGFEKCFNKYSEETYYKHKNLGLYLVYMENGCGYAPAILVDNIQSVRKGAYIEFFHELQNFYKFGTGVDFELKMNQYTLG